jgi:hypothetical protein
MRRTEDYWTFPLLTDLFNSFQSLFVNDDLFVYSSEDFLHDLSHHIECSMIVVRNDCFNICDRRLHDLSVDLVL